VQGNYVRDDARKYPSKTSLAGGFAGGAVLRFSTRPRGAILVEPWVVFAMHWPHGIGS
jgi:hypothetical protein